MESPHPDRNQSLNDSEDSADRHTLDGQFIGAR